MSEAMRIARSREEQEELLDDEEVLELELLELLEEVDEELLELEELVVLDAVGLGSTGPGSTG